jgi:N-acetylglucosamine-6-sulfatase
MSRLAAGVVGIAIALAGACADRPGVSQASRPPNIVFVLVDDLRWDDFGAAGHPFSQTPNIDRVAREGARFLNAFATTPLCSPSRATFLTGQYAHTHGIVDNTARDEASHRLKTFAPPLQAAGYATAFMGKWHMGNDDTPRPGFSHWVAMKGQGEAENPKLNVDGQRIERQGYVTDILTEYATAFLKRSADKPFMLMLSHKALHPNFAQAADGSISRIGQGGTGFVPAPRHRGRYATAVVPRRPNAMKAPVGKPALQRKIDNLPPLGPATGTRDAEVRDRVEMLLAVDESLGRIFDTLTALGQLDNTMIIVAGDHGYFYGEHGLNEERRLAYEESARMPLLIRYPGQIAAGTTPAQLVLNLDVAPTLLDVAGLSPEPGMQGTSLRPLFSGAAPPWRKSFLIEYYTDIVFPRIRNMGYEAVRTERYTYIHYLELPGMDELYDLKADPYEVTNIMNAPAGRAALPEVQVELARLQRETGYTGRAK